MTAQFLFADLVKDTSSAQSSTTITLSGSPGTGFQSFNAGIGDGNYTVYKVSDTSGNWEVTYGVYTNTGKTLGRYSTPLSSSNAGAQVTAFSGTVTVACVDPAPYLNGDIGLAGVGQGLYRPLFCQAQTAVALATGTVFYTPVWIKQWFSSVVLHIDITTLSATSTSTIGMGLYANAGGKPGSVLGTPQTGMNSSTTGGSTGDNATSAITMPLPQPPGIYWVAYLAANASPTVEVISGTGGIGAGEIIGISSSTQTSPFYGYSQSSSTFPSTAGSLTSLNSGGVAAINVAASF